MVGPHGGGGRLPLGTSNQADSVTLEILVEGQMWKKLKQNHCI